MTYTEAYDRIWLEVNEADGRSAVESGCSRRRAMVSDGNLSRTLTSNILFSSAAMAAGAVLGVAWLL